MIEQYRQLMKFLEHWKTIEDKEDQFTKFKNSELGQENTKVRFIKEWVWLVVFVFILGNFVFFVCIALQQRAKWDHTPL